MEEDLFGATALHRRIPFKDVAILSRSIVVTTRPQPGSARTPFKPESFSPLAEKLKELAMGMDWQAVKEQASDRITDTWVPLLEVAAWLGDEEWTTYAVTQMEKAATNLSLGQEEEPTQAVFSELLAIAVYGGKVRERVEIKTIAEGMCSPKLNSWQVGDLLRGMGFKTKKTGGKQYVLTGGEDKLVEVGKALGIQDEWLEAEEEAKAA